jgi:polysaccharide biosynthesis PFTS motif protein
LDPSYELTVESLLKKNGFLEVDFDTSVAELTRKSQIVISVPFNATALISRELGKSSLYYDPRAICQKNDPAAYEITIISRCFELFAWFKSLRFEGNNDY